MAFTLEERMRMVHPEWFQEHPGAVPMGNNLNPMAPNPPETELAMPPDISPGPEQRASLGPTGYYPPVNYQGPVSAAPGGDSLLPASPQGLYAIYGRQNPRASRLEFLKSMAGRDMGGRLGQLPGVVATALAGREMGKAEDFEAKKQADIDAYMKRQEAYDKIKADQAALDRNINLVGKIGEIATGQYFGDLDAGKSLQDTGLSAADRVNQIAKDYNIPLPLITSVNFWKGGDMSMAFKDAEKEETIQLVKKNGHWAWMTPEGPKDVPSTALIISDFAKAENAESARIRANKSPAGGSSAVTDVYRKPDPNNPGKFIEQKIKGTAAQAAAAGWKERQTKEVDKYGDVIGFSWGSIVGEEKKPAITIKPELSKDAQDADAWLKANPNAPAAQRQAIAKKYGLQP